MLERRDLIESISDSSKHLKFEITPNEKRVLDEIVAVFPPSITTRKGLTQWCNREVPRILEHSLENYDENRVGKFRALVRNELIYKLLKPEVDQLISTLRLRGVDWWNFQVINDIDRLLLKRIRQTILTEDGGFDGSYFSKKISEDYRLKFLPEVGKHKDIHRVRERIIEKVRALKPSSFNVNWLIKHGLKSLYNRAIESFTWAEIMQEGEIPEDVFDLWRPGLSDEGRLAQSTLMSSRDQRIKLNAGMRKPRNIVAELRPQKQYDNEEEVQSIIGDKRYLLLMGAHDLKMTGDMNLVRLRDEVFSQLVVLAQKGNKQAEDILVESLSFLAEELITTVKELAGLQSQPKVIRRAIMGSIYKYGKTNTKWTRLRTFISWFYSFLKEECKWYGVMAQKRDPQKF